MKKKALIIVGIAYAVAIAGLATGNLLHNFFGINGVAEHKVDDDPFSDFDNSTPSSSTPSSHAGNSSGSKASSQTSIETRVANTDPSPYETTTMVYTRYNPSTYDPDGECYDSQRNTITFYTLEVKIKKITDFRTNQVTDSRGYPGDNCLSDLYSQVNDVEKKYNVNVMGAINGDSSYNNLDHRLGYVLRNGQLLRSQYRTGNDSVFEDLVLWNDGTMSLYTEPGYTGTVRNPALPTYSTDYLTYNKAWQVWTFGPTLIKDGVISVDEDDDVASPHQTGNQRTAIGYIGPYHYIFFVSQGRNNANKKDGFSLHEVAERLLARGCTLAYNLDGGDSSTLYCVWNESTKKYPSKKNPRAIGDMLYVVDA